MREPTQPGPFLACVDFHKLRGLALQLDLAGIDDEQLSAVMANATSNLPADERVLIRRIISHQENGFRLIQLLHSEQGIAGAVAQRGDQSGVICRTVMVNVVGSKGGPRQLLQQIILFIRSAIRTNEENYL